MATPQAGNDSPPTPTAPVLCWLAQLWAGGLLGASVLFCAVELDAARAFYRELGLGALGWLAFVAAHALGLLGLAHPRRAVAAACFVLLPCGVLIRASQLHPTVKAGHHGALPVWMAWGVAAASIAVIVLRGVLPALARAAERRRPRQAVRVHRPELDLPPNASRVPSEPASALPASCATGAGDGASEATRGGRDPRVPATDGVELERG